MIAITLLALAAILTSATLALAWWNASATATIHVELTGRRQRPSPQRTALDDSLPPLPTPPHRARCADVQTLRSGALRPPRFRRRGCGSGPGRSLLGTDRDCRARQSTLDPRRPCPWMGGKAPGNPIQPSKHRKKVHPMSELDDIYSRLGIPATDPHDIVSAAVADVAHGKIREAQRKAAAELSNLEQAKRIAELEARANDPDAMPLTMAEANELDRNARTIARDEQEARARDLEERRSKAARTGTTLPEDAHRAAWADWFTGNGKGHGIPEPKIEDFQ